MSKESEIKQLIRNISAYNSGLTLFEAEVTKSEDTECVIKYQGLEHKNVRLVCGFSQSLTTMIIKPAVGSTVLVADLSNGKMRDLVVLMVEKAETVIFNGGELGGLIKIEELKKSLDSLKKYCEALKDAVSQGLTAVGVGTAASGSVGAQAFNSAMTGKNITIEDMEDDKIKH